MPPSTVIPVLGYPDVRDAVEWLQRAFGFVERLRIGDHRSQLSVGDGHVVAVSSNESSSSGAGDSVMVRVDDVATHYERALEAGARIIGAPAEYPYGEKQYTALDCAGHSWTFSETLADVDPAEWGGVLRT